MKKASKHNQSKSKIFHSFGFFYDGLANDRLRENQKNTRSVYFRRAIKCLLILPFDMLLIVKRFLSRCDRCEYIVSTNKFSWLPDVIDSHAVGVVSPYYLVDKNKTKNSTAIPVAFLYSVIGLTPWRYSLMRNLIDEILPSVYSKILGMFVQNRVKLIVHSDSLPFARVLIKSLTKKNVFVICIQHGSFNYSIDQIFPETCGMYSHLNIVRSLVDRDIIRKRSRFNEFHVIPELFLPTFQEDGILPNSPDVVLFIGEGYHVLDSRLSIAMQSKYNDIWQQLSGKGFQCIYRRHPSEIRDNQKCEFKDVDSLDLGASIARSLCVIGYSSSVLIESASIGVTSYQIPIDGEYFQGLNREACKIQLFNSVEKLMEDIKVDRRMSVDLINYLHHSAKKSLGCILKNVA